MLASNLPVHTTTCGVFSCIMGFYFHDMFTFYFPSCSFKKTMKQFLECHWMKWMRHYLRQWIHWWLSTRLCIISIANAMEILQSCTLNHIYRHVGWSQFATHVWNGSRAFIYVILSSKHFTAKSCEVTELQDYRQTSNISRTWVGNKIADHSDVVGASPVGAAPTTSSLST